MVEGLPPIHDVVRFWHRNEGAILEACIQFRRTPLPGWTLAWLRHAAPIIVTRELSEIALRHAVREKVFPEARPSVLKAVELFCKFAEKHEWKGRSLSPRAYQLPSGAVIKIAAIGKYFSKFTDSEWLVALQPRQDDAPSPEQFSMWRSALSYQFCNGQDNAMIVDLSMNHISKKRELQEVTSRKHPLIDRSELESRFEIIAACYRKAIEIVPERPPARKTIRPDDPSFEF